MVRSTRIAEKCCHFDGLAAISQPREQRFKLGPDDAQRER
jgi:hypothetical protein